MALNPNVMDFRDLKRSQLSDSCKDSTRPEKLAKQKTCEAKVLQLGGKRRVKVRVEGSTPREGNG